MTDQDDNEGRESKQHCDNNDFGIVAPYDDDHDGDLDHLPKDAGMAKCLSTDQLKIEEQAKVETSVKIQITMQKKIQKAAFIGIVTLNSRSRFSLSKYGILVNIMKEHETLPSSSTIRMRVFQYGFDNLTVCARIASFRSRTDIFVSVKRSPTQGDTSTFLLEREKAMK